MRTLGKYELLQQLGTGSMGTVYLARDTLLEREVALKTIRTDGAVEPEIRERFYREARTCARLQHPNIVTVHDLGDQDGFAYIAMELLRGSDFREIIEQRKPLDLNCKLRAMIQICQALAHAHREGIIHRDVKPSNLFLTADLRAKVLDFGIARLPSSRLTVVGRVLGTPNYMAPEQILTRKSDGRADLFSAAVVFFELLVYQHPFQASLIPRRVVDGEPDSIFDHDSSLPTAFDSVFARALSKDPDTRYATGDEFAADLEAVLQASKQMSVSNRSFSLPLKREPPAAEIAPGPILNPGPDSADPEEWRLSEFLRIFPEFERAVDAASHADAKRALASLRAIEAVDPRFSESIRVCESRLAAIEPPDGRVNTGEGSAALEEQTILLPPGFAPQLIQYENQHENARASGAPHAVPPLAVSSESIIFPASESSSCAKCGAGNRVGALFCLSCGTPMSARAASPSPVKSVSIESPAPASLLRPIEPPASKAVPSSAGGDSRLNAERRSAPDTSPPPVSQQKPTGLPAHALRRIWVGGGIALLLLLAIALFALLRKSAEPYVASATLLSQADLRKSAELGSAVVSRVGEGTRVHILSLSPTGVRDSFRVQVVRDGRGGEVGYIAKDDLGEFDARDAAVLFTLGKSLGSGAGESDRDLIRQIGVYDRVARLFGGTDQAKAAAYESARLDLEMARRRLDQHLADWTIWVSRARALAAPYLPEREAVEINDEGARIGVEAQSGGKQ